MKSHIKAASSHFSCALTIGIFFPQWEVANGKQELALVLK